MFKYEEKTIYVTRGDVGSFEVTADFKAGDIVRFKVTAKKDCEKVVCQRDFEVSEDTSSIEIALDDEATRLGDVISKPTDYWYEVELNPDTNPQTIIGYDEDGAKILRLFPEGADVNGEDIEVVGKKTLQELVEYALLEAKESGEFDGPQGIQGETGPQGPAGPQGETGYTPVLGVDYWTEADKKEIESYIDDNLGEFEEQLSDIGAQCDALSDSVFGTRTDKQIRNVLNINDPDVVKGKRIDTVWSDGYEYWVTDSAYNESGFIPVTGSRFYMYQTDSGLYFNQISIAHYDADKNPIGYSLQSNSKNYREFSDDVAYIRVPFYSSERGQLTIMFFTDEGDEVPSKLSATAYNDVIFTISGGEAGIVDHVEDLQNNIAKATTSHWSEKRWYAYGTSLTSAAQGKYLPVVAELSGLNVTNKGIGGGGIVNNTQIKNAVMNTTDGKLNADLITLEVGANDGTATIGTVYDTGDDTFCGALNQCIRYLQENTTAQIVVLSSTRDTGYPLEATFGTDNHTKFDQWKATEEVCKLNSVYYIPMGENAGIGGARMGNKYLVDNIHHTEIGGYNLGQFVWSRLKNIPLWFTEITT